MKSHTDTILYMKESGQRFLSMKQTVYWQTTSPVILTTDGAVRIEMEGIEYKLNAKDSVFVRSDIAVMMQSLDHAQVVIHTVSFEQYTLASNAQNELIYKLNHDDLPDNGELVKGSSLLFSYIKQIKACKSIQEQMKWLEDMIHIFRHQSQPYTENVHYSIEMILQYLAEHYDQKLTRKNSAHKMGSNKVWDSSDL
ncbi:hypothetical protein ACSLGF_14870 [Bacillus sp. A015]